MPNIITTTYEGPDLDGYSCAVAYAELLRAQGKDAEAAVWGEPQLEVQWLLKEFGISPIGPIRPIGRMEVVLLDTSDLAGVPAGLKPEDVVEIIDHRKLTQLEAFPNAKTQVELVGAAATLVAERFKAVGMTPSRKSALLLYGGILSNTQNFKHFQVTDRDREMAGWLAEVSQAPSDLVERMFTAKSDLSGDRLRKALDGDLKVMQIQGRQVVTMQPEIFRAAELVKDRLLEIEQIVREFAASNNATLCYANIKDLETSASYIFCGNEATKQLFSCMPGVIWDGSLGYSTQYTLRKQINVWIDGELSRT